MKQASKDFHVSTNLQILARMSPLPVANSPPLAGLGATEMTRAESVSRRHTYKGRCCGVPIIPEFLWPCNMSCASPVLGSQNCTPLSFEPDRTHCPSGVRATLRTKSCFFFLSVLHQSQNPESQSHLVSLKRPDALSAAQLSGSEVGVMRLELPHPNGPIQTTRHELTAGW